MQVIISERLESVTRWKDKLCGDKGGRISRMTDFVAQIHLESYFSAYFPYFEKIGAESIFMKLDMYIMAPDPISAWRTS
jgi:hypothetical protein